MRYREVIVENVQKFTAKVLLGGALGERSLSRSTSNCAMRRIDIFHSSENFIYTVLRKKGGENMMRIIRVRRN